MQVSSANVVTGIAAAAASMRLPQKITPFLSSNGVFMNGMFCSPVVYRWRFYILLQPIHLKA
jgi:hypothetical protein